MDFSYLTTVAGVISLILGFGLLFWGKELFRPFLFLCGAFLGGVLGFSLGAALDWHIIARLFCLAAGAAILGTVFSKGWRGSRYLVGGLLAAFLLSIPLLGMKMSVRWVWLPQILLIAGGVYLSWKFRDRLPLVLPGLAGGFLIFNVIHNPHPFWYGTLGNSWRNLQLIYKEGWLLFILVALQYAAFSYYFQTKTEEGPAETRVSRARKRLLVKCAFGWAFLAILSSVLAIKHYGLNKGVYLSGISLTTWPILVLVFYQIALFLTSEDNRGFLSIHNKLKGAVFFIIAGAFLPPLFSLLFQYKGVMVFFQSFNWQYGYPLSFILTKYFFMLVVVPVSFYIFIYSYDKLPGLGFLAPATLCFAFFSWWPILWSMVISMQDYSLNPNKASKWVGFKNYRDAISDPNFGTAWFNVIFFVGMALIIGFFAPVVLSILINELRHAQSLFRLGYYLPAILPIVVITLIWKYLYHPGPGGLFNTILRNAGVFLGFFLFLWIVVAVLFLLMGKLRQKREAMSPFNLAVVGIPALIALLTAAELASPGVLGPARSFLSGDAAPVIPALMAPLLGLLFLKIGRAESRGSRLGFSFLSGLYLVFMAVLWHQLYNPAIARISLGPLEWLNTDKMAITSIVIMTTWRGAGSTMIIYLAALQGIPSQLYEAAEIDGAGIWKRLWYITLPQLLPIMSILLILQILATFKVFAEPWIMTYKRTQTVMSLIYETAFHSYNMGMATAMSMILFAALVALSIFYFWLQKKALSKF